MIKRKPRLLKSSVGIICPTHSPDDFLNKLLPSVEHIKELAPIATWLVNFNGEDWTPSSIYDALNALTIVHGFEMKWAYTGLWNKPIKILKMREQCARMKPDCELYLFIDDDFKFVKRTEKYPFSSGQRYLHSIDYMTRFKNCGVINTKSFLGGVPWKLKIAPTKDGMYATNQGLFLRNMISHDFLLAPKEAHSLRGGLEETLMVLARIELGYFCAQQMNNPTVHITGKLSDWDDKPDDFHNIEMINQNIGAYLRNKYDDWEWLYDERKFPKELWKAYKENGGLDIGYKDPEYTIDYAEYEGWDPNSVG